MSESLGGFQGSSDMKDTPDLDVENIGSKIDTEKYGEYIQTINEAASELGFRDIEVLRSIGEGAEGRVFLVRASVKDEKRIMAAKTGKKGEESFSGADSLRESRTIEDVFLLCKGKTNIMPPQPYGYKKDTIFMEFIDGKPIECKDKNENLIHALNQVNYISTILDGGYYILDAKPDNFVSGFNKNPRALDLGGYRDYNLKEDYETGKVVRVDKDDLQSERVIRRLVGKMHSSESNIMELFLNSQIDNNINIRIVDGRISKSKGFEAISKDKKDKLGMIVKSEEFKKLEQFVQCLILRHWGLLKEDSPRSIEDVIKSKKEIELNLLAVIYINGVSIDKIPPNLQGLYTDELQSRFDDLSNFEIVDFPDKTENLSVSVENALKKDSLDLMLIKPLLEQDRSSYYGIFGLILDSRGDIPNKLEDMLSYVDIQNEDITPTERKYIVINKYIINQIMRLRDIRDEINGQENISLGNISIEAINQIDQYRKEIKIYVKNLGKDITNRHALSGNLADIALKFSEIARDVSPDSWRDYYRISIGDLRLSLQQLGYEQLYIDSIPF